jgi:O-antigen/teichoic acid export membrane protein
MARHARASEKVLQNSIFLMGTTGLTALLSFAFWALVARLFSASHVGLATSLISAISLISYMSLCGMNSTLIRFAAPPKARNSQITLALLAVGTAAVVIASAYLIGLPWYGQKLMFIRADWWMGALFVGICVFAALNVITDTVFISARIPQYNLLADGVIQGVARLLLPLGLVGTGALGIVGAMGGGYTLAVLASLALMWWRLDYRVDLRTRGTGLRKYAKFSAASYLSALLNLLPALALPLIVLQRLGSADAGYYYIAFQIAGMLTAVCAAVGEAMFSEASHDLSRIGEVLKRSAKIMVITGVPAAAIVAGGSGLLLSLFGAQYAANARPLLVVLAAGVLAVVLNTWASNALRVHRRLRAMVWSNVVFLVVTVVMALMLAPRGLVWLGWAWDAGNLASGLAAAVCIPRSSAAAAPAAQPADARPTEEMPAAWSRPVSGTFLDDTGTIPMIFPWNRPEWSAAAVRNRPQTEAPNPAESHDGRW